VARRYTEIADGQENEDGIAIAATAAVMSPRVRGVLRRGAVLGLAGILKATDSVSEAARGMAQQAQQATSGAANAVQETAAEAKTSVRTSRRGQTSPKGQPEE
jgi:acyl-CoA synthetase (NDP forming)